MPVYILLLQLKIHTYYSLIRAKDPLSLSININGPESFNWASCFAVAHFVGSPDIIPTGVIGAILHHHRKNFFYVAFYVGQEASFLVVIKLS